MRTRTAASDLVLATAFLTRVASCLPNGLQSVYTASGAFPTSLYASYYNDPTATTAEPQPVVSDPVTVSVNFVLRDTCAERYTASGLPVLVNERRGNSTGLISPFRCLSLH